MDHSNAFAVRCWGCCHPTDPVSCKLRGRQDFQTSADSLSAPLPSIVGLAPPSARLEKELTRVGCDLALICDSKTKLKKRDKNKRRKMATSKHEALFCQGLVGCWLRTSFFLFFMNCFTWVKFPSSQVLYLWMHEDSAARLSFGCFCLLGLHPLPCTPPQYHIPGRYGCNLQSQKIKMIRQAEQEIKITSLVLILSRQLNNQLVATKFSHKKFKPTMKKTKK